MTRAGRKEVLGLWIEQTEGAKFWLGVMNELKGARRVGRADRGGGRSEGLSGRDRGGVSPGDRADLHRAPHPALAGGGAEDDLRAPTAAAAAEALDAFEAGPWGEKRPMIVRG